MKKIKSKVLFAFFLIALFFLLKKLNLTNYLTLDYLKENLDQLRHYTNSHFAEVIFLYMALYILSTALSLPGATILTLAGGALFGFFKGLLIVSLASTIGATLAFLGARFFFRDYVQNKFSQKLRVINDGVKKEGALYLLSLRLIPIFPFFLINLVMGLTPMKTLTYFFISQLGMLPGTMAYVYAGLKVSELDSLSGVLSKEMLFAFALLGFIPLFSKWLLMKFKNRQVYKKFKKPHKFDYNLVAIGAGAGGLVTSYIGAAVNAKVALIEKHKMGGDCLNTGCVPSKALIKTAKVIHSQTKAQDYGLNSITVSFDFKKVMERVQRVIKKIEPHDSIDRYEGLGVDCIQGMAKIISPWEIEVNGKVLTTKNMVIATGASPFVPPIEGLKDIDFLTSENLWDLTELPKKMLVLGGGPIGVEMAQAFSRLGSKVTIVEMGSRLLGKEDQEAFEILAEQFRAEGINVLTNTKAVRFKENELTAKQEDQEIKIPFDKAFIAVGRKANVKGFGLENLGVRLRDNGTIEVNEYMQTNFPNIFACGDVAGNFQLTHTAAHEAWYASVNALFGRLKKFKVDYLKVPWVTYTDPEVATVGKNESALKKEGISYEVFTYGIDDLDRAIADSEDRGFIKVMTKPDSDKILGATIVASNAGELLVEFTSAMRNGFGLNAILGTIHPYPTMSEANKYTAGVWKQAKKPKKLLKWVEKYHHWMRS